MALAKTQQDDATDEVDKISRRKKSLELQLEQAKAMAAQAVPPVIKTEEGRYLSAMLVRLLETLVHGEAITPMPTRHNP